MRPAEIDRMDITEDDPCLCAVTYLDGEYKRAVSLLYGIAYTVRMSKMGTHRIEGYFDHVVPPLEGFWRQEGSGTFDPSRKEDPEWISVIRLPDFVTKDDFEWAPEEAARKKKADFSKAFFFPFGEGLCVRCLHIGPCDEEPRTIAAMRAFIRDRGYALDLTERRGTSRTCRSTCRESSGSPPSPGR